MRAPRATHLSHNPPIRSALALRRRRQLLGVRQPRLIHLAARHSARGQQRRRALHDHLSRLVRRSSHAHPPRGVRQRPDGQDLANRLPGRDQQHRVCERHSGRAPPFPPSWSWLRSRPSIGARRQLLLPVSDNYFCRRRVGKGVPLSTAAELGNGRWPVAGRVCCARPATSSRGQELCGRYDCPACRRSGIRGVVFAASPTSKVDRPFLMVRVWNP